MSERGQISYQIISGVHAGAAVRVREEVFLKDFGQIGDDGKDSVGYHLLALNECGEIIAGFRLLGPEVRPFAFEKAYDLSAVVRAGAQPALLGRLFVRQDFRGATTSMQLLIGLLELGRSFAAGHSITDFYISAFGHLVRLYERAGFSNLGVEVTDDHWQTLHLMHMRV
ncbi:GNAT family N-acetyltransferase [bacterium]|nr:GNAT family N-acetyltransferase [bacterium]